LAGERKGPITFTLNCGLSEIVGKNFLSANFCPNMDKFRPKIPRIVEFQGKVRILDTTIKLCLSENSYRLLPVFSPLNFNPRRWKGNENQA